jgi:hypothetical protein
VGAGRRNLGSHGGGRREPVVAASTGRRQKGAFYSGSQLGLCLVGCFLFS